MAKRGKVFDKDLGYAAIRKQIRELVGLPYVAIGVQGESAMERKQGGGKPGPATVVDVATFHEFGVPADMGSQRIPKRSFIRATVDKNQKKYENVMSELGRQILNPKKAMDIDTALGLMGQLVEADIKASFTNNDWPALKDTTRGGRNPDGGAKPLIDTGQLRQSIRYQIIKDGRKK